MATLRNANEFPGVSLDEVADALTRLLAAIADPAVAERLGIDAARLPAILDAAAVARTVAATRLPAFAAGFDRHKWQALTFEAESETEKRIAAEAEVAALAAERNALNTRIRGAISESQRAAAAVAERDAEVLSFADHPVFRRALECKREAARAELARTDAELKKLTEP